MQFVIPKEPQLLLRMLYPRLSGSKPAAALNGKNSYDVFWARNAIYHGVRALGFSSGDNVLVPAFHCSSLVEPILRLGAKVKFYNINRDCSPDFADLHARIDRNTRAVVAIHYFGFSQPIRKFRDLCRDYGLYLVEDCAHVLTSQDDGKPLGAFGDISVFSLRKFFPVYDGGRLVVNNPSLHVDIPWQKSTFLVHAKIAKNVVDKLMEDSSVKVINRMAGVLRIPDFLRRRLVAASGSGVEVFTMSNYGVDFDVNVANLGMSAFSKYILRNIDITEVVRKRRANYILLQSHLESLPGVTCFFPLLPHDVCPWVFPMLVSHRRDFHLALRCKGIPAFTWGGVIHPELRREEFPAADFLYQNLILLPVHQALAERDIETMVKVIIQSLNERN